MDHARRHHCSAEHGRCTPTYAPVCLDTRLRRTDGRAGGQRMAGGTRGRAGPGRGASSLPPLRAREVQAPRTATRARPRSAPAGEDAIGAGDLT
ncbi:hypothetical protein C2845_PM08G23250 [Panicum miliaceum]|uniref:Uncharacterized protein n=1 Tax=Panicum miliaceum TaxID=4540 RepID=A0A3L6R1D0_PANMI|nr:hypothetical protein C2845_PM08G23250 [Panicum miliaceum]